MAIYMSSVPYLTEPGKGLEKLARGPFVGFRGEIDDIKGLTNEEEIMSLYEVFVYDPMAKVVTFSGFFATKSAESAKRMAVASGKFKDPEKFDFFARLVGTVRKPSDME